MILSQSEQQIAAEVNFEPEILEILKEELQAVEFEKIILEKEVFLEPSDELTDFLPQYYSEYLGDRQAGIIIVKGLSIAIPYLKIRQLTTIKKRLLEKGYLISYWKTLVNFLGIIVAERFPNNFKYNVEIFKGTDFFDLLKIKQTNAWKYNISNQEIVNRLKTWQNFCEFEILMAHKSGVAIEFINLPTNLNSFAKEIYEFCPNFSDINEIVQALKQYKFISLIWD